jgi:hypothetical protein
MQGSVGVAAICNRMLSSSARERLQAEVLGQMQPFHEDILNLSGIGSAKLCLSLTPRLPKDVFLMFLGDEENTGHVW